MLISVTHSQTSVILRVKIRDSTVTTGAGKTGLTHSSSGLIISTIADNEASATVYAQASSNIENITSTGTLGVFATPTSGKCRFEQIDSTNHKGIYEIQIANARFAVASAKSLLISLSGVTGMAECDVVVPLGLPVNVTAGAGTAWNSGAITSSTLASGAITSSALATGAIAAAAVAASAANKIADHVRRRTQANVEASSDGDTLDLSSLYGMIQQVQESEIASGIMTVYKTDGTTILGTKTVTSDAAALPAVGIE